MTMIVSAESDGFEVASKKKSVKKNLYIGNLPTNDDNSELDLAIGLKNLLRDECSLDEADTDLQIHSSATSCHALLLCDNHMMDQIIQKLHGRSFHGKKLVVQRERKKKVYDTTSTIITNHGQQKTFKGWSQPMVERVSQVAKEEIEHADDPVDSATAATAAVGVMTSLSANVLLSQPMNALLADYGDQDLEWKQMITPNIKNTESEETAAFTEQRNENRLTKLGKAPIHVQFYSFGYHRGAPNEIRNGWSHAQPLPVHDCRDLGTVPGHLIWQDGLSGVVKRELLWNTDIRKVSNNLGDRTADAVMAAINEGGHGFALPLKMLVLVASELGKHRSVLCCELAATALRKRLRSNENNQFREPCSVDTFHRDLPYRAPKGTTTKNSKRDIFED